MSEQAIALTKTLLYQIDGLAFPEALETGADVNVIARMTEDCQKGIAKFLQNERKASSQDLPKDLRIND